MRAVERNTTGKYSIIIMMRRSAGFAEPAGSKCLWPDIERRSRPCRPGGLAPRSRFGHFLGGMRQPLPGGGREQVLVADVFESDGRGLEPRGGGEAQVVCLDFLHRC